MNFENLDILETQNENEQYQCNNCGKLFANSTIFHEHMQMHNGEKPFKCSICGNSFQNDTSLNEHMEVHNLVKPFQSIYISCSDSLVNNTTLKEDIAHTGEKNISV